MLGRDQAAILMREFEDREVAEIVMEMTRLDFVSEEQQAALLLEFAEVAHMAETCKRGGPEFAQEVLEMRLGAYKASEIISRIAPAKRKVVDETLTKDLESKMLFLVISKETVQTQALVLSHMAPRASAEILEQFSPAHRVDVIERMGLMEPIPVEVVEQILTKVRERCAMKGDTQFSHAGGAQSLAHILNSMDEGTLKKTLADLQQRNPALGQKVKQLLFVFEDIADLDDRTILEVTRNVEMPELACALKTATDRVKNAIYRAFPKRRADYLRDEIESMPTVRITDVQAAQAKICKIVDELQSQGVISTNKGNKLI